MSNVNLVSPKQQRRSQIFAAFTNVIRLKLPSLIKNDTSGKALASGRRTMFNTPQELQSIFPRTA